MIFLGIDPGSKCGWALLDNAGQRIASGTWDLSAKRHEGGGMRFVRLDRYMTEVVQNIKVVALSAGGDWNEGHLLVAYEEVRRHQGVDAAHIYGGVIATVARICEAYHVPYRGIPVGTVKKFATGRGNADKPAMIAAANERWGISITDDNEADAIWIAAALMEGKE